MAVSRSQRLLHLIRQVYTCECTCESNIRAAGSICGVMSLRAAVSGVRASSFSQRSIASFAGSPLDEMRLHKKDTTRDDAALDCFNELLQGELPDMLTRSTDVLLCSRRCLKSIVVCFTTAASDGFCRLFASASRRTTASVHHALLPHFRGERLKQKSRSHILVCLAY